MTQLLKNVLPFGVAILITTSACKNNTQQTDTADSAATDSLPATEQPQVIQHNFPEAPENIVTDSTFKVGGKKVRMVLTQKTIDTSLVVIDKSFKGKLFRDVYSDYEYFIQFSGPDFNTGNIKITKHDFRSEFNDEFFNYAVLYKITFLGYNDATRNFEFSLMINKPDTDNTYKIFYYVDKKGTTRYEIEDV